MGLSDIFEDGENRKNLLRVFRKQLRRNIVSPSRDLDIKKDFVKDANFNIENTDLADELAKNLSEKSRRKKSKGDDAAVDTKANDYESLVTDIKRTLSRIP